MFCFAHTIRTTQTQRARFSRWAVSNDKSRSSANPASLEENRPCPLHTAHLPATDDVRPCWLQLLPGRDKECVSRKFFLHLPSFISTTVTKYLDDVLIARTSCSWSINWSKRSPKVQSPVLTQDNGHGKVKSASKIQSSCELPPQRRTMAYLP